MAYAHFEDHDEVIVSAKVGTSPEDLAGFILGSVVKAHEDKLLTSLSSAEDREASRQLLGLEMGGVVDVEGRGSPTISPLEASERALLILKDTVDVVEKHIRLLRAMEKSSGTVKRVVGQASLPHITTPEIMKRYSAAISNSPRSAKWPKPPSGASSSSALLSVPSSVVARSGKYDSLEDK